MPRGRKINLEGETVGPNGGSITKTGGKAGKRRKTKRSGSNTGSARVTSTVHKKNNQQKKIKGVGNRPPVGKYDMEGNKRNRKATRSTASGASKGKEKGHSFSSGDSHMMPTAHKKERVWHRPNKDRVPVKKMNQREANEVSKVAGRVDKKLKKHIKLRGSRISKDNSATNKNLGGGSYHFASRDVKLDKRNLRKGGKKGKISAPVAHIQEEVMGKKVGKLPRGGIIAHEIGHDVDAQVHNTEKKTKRYADKYVGTDAKHKQTRNDAGAAVKAHKKTPEGRKHFKSTGRSDTMATKASPPKVREENVPGLGKVAMPKGKNYEDSSIMEHFPERFRHNLGYKTRKDHPTHGISKNRSSDHYMNTKVLGRKTRPTGPRPGTKTSTASMSRRPAPKVARVATAHSRPRSTQTRRSAMRVHMTRTTAAGKTMKRRIKA